MTSVPAPVPPALDEGSFEGQDSVVLSAGGYEATFVPELGMLGTSLVHDGKEYLSLHGGVDAYREGHTTGLPLLHPWANRLARSRYEFAGTWVEFDGELPVRLLAGLPIHGTMAAARGWQVEAQFADSTRAVLQARFVFDQPERLQSFPFPHDLVLFIEVSDLGLKLTTTVHAGAKDVPVSFGWHPSFALPGVPRRGLSVVLPDIDHLELDGQMLPTGVAKRQDAVTVLLGDGSLEKLFDDSYRLLDEPGSRVLAIAGTDDRGEARRLSIELDENYPYAQVYAPSDKAFVALEPMTAPTNALVTGDHPTVPAGETFNASFRIWVDEPAVDEADHADEADAKGRTT